MKRQPLTGQCFLLRVLKPRLYLALKPRLYLALKPRLYLALKPRLYLALVVNHTLMVDEHRYSVLYHEIF